MSCWCWQAKLLAADFLWPAYDRRYGRRRLIYACGATRTFRDCLNDHFLQRDDFAVTARVLGALFYYSPESHETAPLVQALLTDDWQAQWPLDAEALAPVAAMFKTHSEESLPQAGSACLSALTLCRLRRGVPSGWIVRAYYLAILHWRYVSGCAKTEFSLKCSKTSQKIILGRCCYWRLWLAENDRHHECEQLGTASVSVVVPLSGRIYRSCRASVLSGVGATGASDAGAMASSTHYSRRCKTVIPLIPTKAGFYLPFLPLRPIFIYKK